MAIARSRDEPARDALMVQSVGKAFSLLLAFDAQNPTLSLTQLAAVAGLDRSATQRFAHTLLSLGYLRKDPRSKRFSLAARMLDLANRFMITEPLIAVARPYLLHLARETQETVNLSVRDGAEVLFVTRIIGRHVLNVDVTIGSRHPVYCTSPGIAMLAAMPPAEARAILASSDRRPLTHATVWEMEPLLQKVAQAARRGFATTVEEIYVGDIAVAAAIRDGRGRPLGAINVAALRSRVTPEEVERRYGPMVMEAAQSISQACGTLG
ncbi:IclR family transcriptional regulator [Roseomonas sp. 18066]|uniref:IclR family transcriptional regulator n=1 Tax=Roseomonas sp. 18066 TaxID=2681412 RepID=UPI00190F4C48|nr:IclR family transcriptional regulator [Roseomonas sp. 18066]